MDSVNSAELRLQTGFAVVSALGGLALASNVGTETIPMIAVFFAVFGFVFVDRLKLFALPPIGAYIAMGAAAIYCVSDFWNLNTTGGQQLVSVALLLVLVQAILMLQVKTPRVFEQILVFCLLQLIVGAVFNDALQFGLLLIPMGIWGIWSLCLMSSLGASEGIDSTKLDSRSELPRPTAFCSRSSRIEEPGFLDRLADHWMFQPIGGSADADSRLVRTNSSSSLISLANATWSLQRFAMLVLVPSMLVVACVFFYALPRTTDAARPHSSGVVHTGFDENVRLENFGRMLKNTSTSLRIRMTDRDSGREYSLPTSIYLRGRVLEIYSTQVNNDQETGTWSSLDADGMSHSLPLPREYIPRRSSEENFFDSVVVGINCVSMRSRSLFAIAPYHRHQGSAGLLHSDKQGTIVRKNPQSVSYPPKDYQFGTNAFNRGIQTDLIAASLPTTRYSIRALSHGSTDGQDASARIRNKVYSPGSYLEKLTDFDPDSMPYLHQLSNDILKSIPPKDRTILEIARAFERHLASSGGFEYSLEPGFEARKMDPIEKFMRLDKRGHCQYFASALVMMLRSVGIPARMVVGYRTNEYNELAQLYVARELHAHAWVEMLIDREQLDPRQLVYGQPKANQYWLRLDPTPGESMAVANAPVGGVDQVLTYAEDIWENIVGMDAQRQEEIGVDPKTLTPMSNLMSWIQFKILQLRAGDLGGGSLAARDFFSLRGALIAMGLMVVLVMLTRISWPRLSGSFGSSRQIQANGEKTGRSPKYPFYVETLNLAARLGFSKSMGETPSEFVSTVCAQLSSSRAPKKHQEEIVHSLRELTNHYYGCHYGKRCVDDELVESQLAALRDNVNYMLEKLGWDIEVYQIREKEIEN